MIDDYEFYNAKNLSLWLAVRKSAPKGVHDRARKAVHQIMAHVDSIESSVEPIIVCPFALPLTHLNEEKSDE